MYRDQWALVESPGRKGEHDLVVACCNYKTLWIILVLLRSAFDIIDVHGTVHVLIGLWAKSSKKCLEIGFPWWNKEYVLVLFSSYPSCFGCCCCRCCSSSCRGCCLMVMVMVAIELLCPPRCCWLLVPCRLWLGRRATASECSKQSRSGMCHNSGPSKYYAGFCF